MSNDLDRDNIIRLLNQLGSDKDEDILTSARALNAQMTGANADWNDLLVGQAEPVAEEEVVVEEEDTSEDSNNGKSLSDVEAIKIIDRLIAKEDITEYMKEELEDYKTDIADGEFQASDRSYLLALNKRLS